MSFTLKISSFVQPVGGGGDATWITGVNQVSRIGQAMTSEHHERWAGYFQNTDTDLRNFSTSATPQPGDDSDYRLTLLSVRTVNGEFYAIVEMAWLLGSNGDTIERVAP